MGFSSVFGKDLEISCGIRCKLSRCLEDLLDTAEVQRLRRVSSLGYVSFVYPDGTHSRFGHSLRVAHWGRKMLESACRNGPVKLDFGSFDKLVSATLLLHDVGHGPFSHGFQNVLEFFTGMSHEEVTGKIIAGEFTMSDYVMKLPGSVISDIDRMSKLKIYKKLPSVPHVLSQLGLCNSMIAQIIDMSRGDFDLVGDNVFLRQLVSGLFDADRVAYLQHDPDRTGLRQCIFDPEAYLISQLYVVEAGGQKVLALDKSALTEVRQLLDVRSKMHTIAYTHPTVLKIEAMMYEAAKRALGNLVGQIPEKDMGLVLYLMDDNEFERFICSTTDETALWLYNTAKLDRNSKYVHAYSINRDNVKIGTGVDLALQKIHEIQGVFPEDKVKKEILGRVNAGKDVKLEDHEVIVYFRKVRTDPSKTGLVLSGFWIVDNDSVYNAKDRLDDPDVHDQELLRIMDAINNPINYLDFTVLCPAKYEHRVQKASEEYIGNLKRA